MGASEGKRRGVKARRSWIICGLWCVRWPALPGVTVRSPVSMISKGVLSEEMTQAWTKVTVAGTGKTTALGKHTSLCCDMDKVQGCPPPTSLLASSSIEVTPFPLVQTEKPSLRHPQWYHEPRTSTASWLSLSLKMVAHRTISIIASTCSSKEQFNFMTIYKKIF